MPRASSPLDMPEVSGSVTPTAASFAWAIASGGSIAAARDALDSPVRSPSDSTASTSPSSASATTTSIRVKPASPKGAPRRASRRKRHLPADAVELERLLGAPAPDGETAARRAAGGEEHQLGRRLDVQALLGETG